MHSARSLLVIGVLASCGMPAGVAHDAAVRDDAPADAITLGDAGPDARADAPSDAPPDAGPDAGPDAPLVIDVVEAFPTSLAFDKVEIGFGEKRLVQIHNAGSAAATIGAVTVTGAGWSIRNNYCIGTHAPGDTCGIEVLALPSDLAMITGSLVVHASGVDLTIPLSARGARRVRVVKEGNGTGTVTMGSAAVTCGATCSVLADDDLVLGETPGQGSTFLGWTVPPSIAGCGTNLACTVPKSTEPITIIATSAPTGSVPLHISYVGGGTGVVQVTSGGTTSFCVASCTVFVMPGTVMLTADATAEITSFSGACQGVGLQCAYTQGAGASSVTITLSGADPKARWAYLGAAGSWLTSATFDSSDNLVALSGGEIIKLSPTGTLIWRRPFPAYAITAGPNGTIDALSSMSVIKLDSTGAQLWARPWGGPTGSPYFGKPIASASDGAVAVYSQGTVARWAADGTPSWSIAVLSDENVSGVGFDAQGNVLIPIANGTMSPNARPYAPDGTAQPLITNIAPVGPHVGIVTDTAGTLVVASSGMKHVFLDMLEMATLSQDYALAGAAANAPGDRAIAYWVNARWTVTRFLTPEGMWTTSNSNYQPSTVNIAMASTGRIALTGSYSTGLGYDGGWLQIFDP